MSSTFTYRSGDCRPVCVATAPQLDSNGAVTAVNGTQYYPIEEGDLLIYVNIIVGGNTYTNCVVPAWACYNSNFTSIQANGGSLVNSSGQVITTISGLKKAFAGVALKKTGLIPGETTARLSQNIDPGYQLVATAGRFEYSCSAQSNGTGAAALVTFNPGDLVCGVASASNYTGRVSGGSVSSATVVWPQLIGKSTHQNDGSVDAIAVATPGFNQLGQSALSCIVDILDTLEHRNLASGL